MPNGQSWVVIFDDALIRLYVECKVLDDAQKVFDEITCLDVIQCNPLILWMVIKMEGIKK